MCHGVLRECRKQLNRRQVVKRERERERERENFICVKTCGVHGFENYVVER